MHYIKCNYLLQYFNTLNARRASEARYVAIFHRFVDSGMEPKSAIDFLIEQSRLSKKNPASFLIDAAKPIKSPYGNLINVWQNSSRGHFRYSKSLHRWYTASKVNDQVLNFYSTLAKNPTVPDFFAGSGSFIDAYNASLKKSAWAFNSLSVFSSEQEKETVKHVAEKTQQIGKHPT